MPLNLPHLCWSAMFGDANCCNLPKVFHHQRGIIIFGNNQYWIVKPEDEMPNEACALSLTLCLSLGWALTDESTGKDSWKATWGNWSVFLSLCLFSLSPLPSLSLAWSLLFLSVFVFLSLRTYVHLKELLLQTGLHCWIVLSSFTWLWISSSILHSADLLYPR